MIEKIPIRPEVHKLAHSYLDAKQCVIAAGFAQEIDWQEGVRIEELTEEAFLHEYTWVVYSSGFRERVLRDKFPSIVRAFRGLRSARVIRRDALECKRAALKAFGHHGKASAVVDTCARIDRVGFPSFLQSLRDIGIAFIDDLQFMGPATSYHLAKNIGLGVVKPDRHLVRIAEATGFASPLALCVNIAQAIGDSLPVIDIVIWRYATLFPKTVLPNFRLQSGSVIRSEKVDRADGVRS